MLHAGLDLTRKRLDVCLLSGQGELVDELTAFPDPGGLKRLAQRVEADGEPVRAVIDLRSNVKGPGDARPLRKRAMLASGTRWS